MPVRYVERENFLIAEANDLVREKSPSDGVIRTQQQLLQQRKDEYLNYNINTFANIVHELPKFADETGDNKKWWTKRPDYITSDTIKSAKEYYLNKINRGKPEAMIMADHSSSPAPADAFKSTYVQKPPKHTGQDPCTEKPGKNIKNKSTDEI